MQEAAAATIDRLGLVACYETRSFWPFWVPFCWVSLAVRCAWEKESVHKHDDGSALPTHLVPAHGFSFPFLINDRMPLQTLKDS